MPPPSKARKAALNRRRKANGDFDKEEPVILEIIDEEQAEDQIIAVTEEDEDMDEELRSWVLESYTNDGVDEVVNTPLQDDTCIDIMDFPSKEHDQQVNEWKDVIVWKAEKQSSRGPYLNNSSTTKWRKKVEQQKALKSNHSIANYFSIKPKVRFYA